MFLLVSRILRRSYRVKNDDFFLSVEATETRRRKSRARPAFGVSCVVCKVAL